MGDFAVIIVIIIIVVILWFVLQNQSKPPIIEQTMEHYGYNPYTGLLYPENSGLIVNDETGSYYQPIYNPAKVATTWPGQVAYSSGGELGSGGPYKGIAVNTLYKSNRIYRSQPIRDRGAITQAIWHRTY